MANTKWIPSKKTYIIILCIVSVIFALCSWVMFVGYNQDLYLQSIKERGEKVSAEIVRAGYQNAFGKGGGYIVLLYEYIDDGVEYDGICGPKFNSWEEAEKHIGEKVEIYIDGGGKSIPADRKINLGSSIIWAVVFIVLCCACITGIVLLSRKVIKERRLEKAGNQSPT